ncbi:putative serine protease K12H4.7 [Atheta coriaria]|uniref:putative serine protease K12H4.7 n=1 Tax=Dalotia coriaria TaxID=877792 RepID=UPI0031F477C1
MSVAMFYTEHRFYGKSMPTTDFTSESLRLLHSSQAQEDLKGFIMMLKEFDRYKNSKVMLFGCSYAGGLVAWMKQKYPELIQVTYSTSGPFYAKDSMFEYLQVISRVIYNLPNIGKQCFDGLFYGIQQLEQEYDSGPEGAASVIKKLGICPPYDPKGDYDKAAVFQTFGVEFGKMGLEDPEKLSNACNRLINATGETYAEKFVNYRTNGTTPIFCYHTVDYDSTAARCADTSLNGKERPWFYQQCNEFGWFVTTETNTQVFGKSVLPFFYHQLCRDAYGATFTDENILLAQENTNKVYGGYTPNVRKSVFVYGSSDPWAPMGVQESLNDEALTFYIQGGGHCSDMFPQSDEDSESMTYAKVNSRAWVKKWLSED